MVRDKLHYGRYRVIALIGAGGFSTVYRALDETNRREVAVKVLAENHSLRAETRRRFVDEYNLRASVNSPFIAQIFEVGHAETGQPFMVLELADRGDLRKRVEEIRRSHRVLTHDDLLTLAWYLQESLTALHAADIVHRDVSPGNILIRTGGSSEAWPGAPERTNVTLLEWGERLLLADLGHAKDLIRASGFTAGGGTQGYAAPEQRDDVTVVDHRADIFSATAVLEWAAHDGFYAEGLEPFFEVGLAEEPDDRHQSMGEWYEELRVALAAVDSDGARRRFRRPRGRTVTKPAVAAPGPQPPSDETVEPVRSRRWGVAFAAAAMTTAIGLVGLAALDLGLGDRAGTEQGVSAGAAGNIGSASGDGVEIDGGRVAAAADSAGGPSTSGPLVVETDGSGQESLGDLVGPIAPGSPPFAAIDQPGELETIDGDLVISGSAYHGDGIDQIELTVRSVATGRYWTPDDPRSTSSEPFSPDLTLYQTNPTTGAFQTTVPEADLEPGDYEIRAWVRGLGSDEPAEPSTRLIVVG